jgi:hypothetical protein
LTQRGKVVIYHYALIDSSKEYLKYLSNIRKSEEKDMAKEAREQMSKEEKTARIKEDKSEAETFTSPFIMIRHVDVIDIVALVKDKHNSLTSEEKLIAKNKAYDIGQDVVFKNLLLTSQKGMRLWIVSDSEGFITSVSRNLRLNGRFKS